MNGLVVLGIVVGFVLYFLPTFIGFRRKRPLRWGILIFNLLLGWTIVFWFVALAWANTPTGQRFWFRLQQATAASVPLGGYYVVKVTAGLGEDAITPQRVDQVRNEMAAAGWDYVNSRYPGGVRLTFRRSVKATDAPPF